MGLFSWFKQKAADEDFRQHIMCESQREYDLAEKGWLSFGYHQGQPSPLGKMIDIIDRDGDILTVEYDKIPPWWNTAGKFWRPSVFDAQGKMIEGRLVTETDAHPSPHLPR